MATMEHTAYVEQMLLSSLSPNHSEPQAEKEKETINNQTDLRKRRWFRTPGTFFFKYSI